MASLVKGFLGLAALFFLVTIGGRGGNGSMWGPLGILFFLAMAGVAHWFSSSSGPRAPSALDARAVAAGRTTWDTRPMVVIWVAIVLAVWSYLYGFSVIGLASKSCSGIDAFWWGVGIATIVVMLWTKRGRGWLLAIVEFIVKVIVGIFTLIGRLYIWIAIPIFIVLGAILFFGGWSLLEWLWKFFSAFH